MTNTYKEELEKYGIGVYDIEDIEEDVIYCKPKDILEAVKELNDWIDKLKKGGEIK